MYRIIVCIVLLLSVGITYSQVEKLHLYKLPDHQKKRTIKNGAYLEVKVRYLDKDSLKAEDLFEGYFLETRNETIVLDLQKKSTFVSLENGMLKQYSLSKGFDTKPFPYIEEAIPVHKISMIQYRNKPAGVFRKIGTITFWTSLATTTLIAPLASINYSKGTFDFDQYKTIVMAGGIGIAVSIPILLLSGRKRVIIEEGLPHSDKSRWTFNE